MIKDLADRLVFFEWGVIRIKKTRLMRGLSGCGVGTGEPLPKPCYIKFIKIIK